MKPVVILVGGQELTTWTEMTLQRSKEELTGSLDVTIFAGAMPSVPIARSAKAGAEIQCYIAGQLAFTGTVDKRQGTGAKKGKDPEGGTDTENEENKGSTSMSVNIGPNEYTIKLSARGKTKRLIDSSHQHPTTNELKPTTKKMTEKLIEPFKQQLEWKAKEIKLDKVRLRDGGRVVDELHRLAIENAYFMYETRDGKLRVTDGVGAADGGGGDPLILGLNILTFSAEQSEEDAKSEVKVKGQRSEKKKWGEDALLKTFKTQKDSSLVKDFAPLIVQHNGDATDEALERRGRYEMNKKNSEAKKITIEVFHVQTPSGAPWDIGNTHYVEVPPEGIFDMFECTQLTYTCTAGGEGGKGDLKTTLVLSPPPSGGAGGSGGGGGGFGLSSLPMNIGAARRSQAGVSMVDGEYPAPWSPPMLSELPLMTLVEAAAKVVTDVTEPKKKPPPMTLPPWWGETT
ncbi:prophage tail gpP-like protein [Bradyrhizobium japonicum]